jgi:hypothetical protein
VTEAGEPAEREQEPTTRESFDVGPGPSRTAFFIAYLGVVLSGLFGAAIGFGLVDAGCRHGDCTASKAVGAIVGAVLAAVGVGVVAVLALRAMAEWRRPPGSKGPTL